MLSELVKDGQLPPVEERLPEDPRVVPAYESVGKYGGTLTVGAVSVTLTGGDRDMCTDLPHMGRLSHDTQSAVPHVLKDWEVSADQTEFTCHMRRGMRWSDGEPVTTENFRYWYEDIAFNTEITPVPNFMIRVGGKPMELDIIDDYTFRIRFGAPNPAVPMNVFAHTNASMIFSPSHYLKQFHIRYNEKANEVAKKQGYDFWYQFHGRQANRAQNIDLPRLECFIPVRDTPSMSFAERNPYYHAVDTEGNQLPYIDKVIMQKAPEISVLDTKIVGGTYDFAGFSLSILNYATYAEAAAESDSRMLLWQSGKGGEVIYHFNHNYPNAEWRSVFQDDRFRQALSMAINRKEINDVIYFGHATETAFTVMSSSRHYRPEYAMTEYAEFDPDKANKVLDEIGLEWNSAHTHRLWPHSKTPTIIPFDMYESETPKGPITELVSEYWKAIGIEIQWKSITRTLLAEKVLANEEPMSLWHGDCSADPIFMRLVSHFQPRYGDNSCWGVLWGQWYDTKGEAGEEPPPVIKDLYTWLDEYNLTDSNEPAANTLKSMAEHVWAVSTVGNAPQPLIVRNYLRNVSETGGYWSWDTLWTRPELPEQWYLDV
ncbi:MAG: ABC transporter substrate-binding protein [Anaerolineae bacterium]|jgi:peptide/nickel transport system substrate-binding protein